MNDAQDDPYSNKENRERVNEKEKLSLTWVFWKPRNLKVCFPKTKFKSTLPTGAAERCRGLRGSPEHRQRFGWRWSTNFTAVRSHILGYGSVIGLVANIRSHSLDLSTPIPGWQRRELGSSETVDLGFGPDSLAVGLWFALKLVLFLRAYSLFLPGASVCVFPTRSDRRTLKKELCLFDSNVSFRSNSLEWFREQSSMPLSLSPSKTLWVDLGYDESELLGFLAKSI